MSREYKNTLKLRDTAFGNERRKNLFKEVLKDSTPLPSPVVYEDIDKEMHRWVDEELRIVFEGKLLPTMDLFSNQRFSEYLQSWKFVDENKNLILNFKTISRENNPKSGTIVGESKNIPGERTYLMKRVEAKDKNNRKYYIDYRMKQPFAIDLVYKVSIMTNKYELINNFNLLVNNKFKAIDCYIRPNGHFMSMVLNDISDESEYNIDDRQFYSQSYNITVKAYIITEDSLSVEEIPSFKFLGFEGETSKGKTNIEDIDYNFDCPSNPYSYQPIKITTVMDECCEKVKFTTDCDLVLQYLKVSPDNLRNFRLYFNDEEFIFDVIKVVTEADKEEEGIFYGNDEFNVGDRYLILDKELPMGSEVKIRGLVRRLAGIDSVFEFYGYDPSIVLNENEETNTEESTDIEMQCEKDE